MLFDVYRVRNCGRLMPRHIMWSTRVRGELSLREVRDDETGRTLRVATIEGVEGPRRKPLAGPLFDATLVGARPDWWTMTGWERVFDSTTSSPLAFQQSWIMIPVQDEKRSGGVAGAAINPSN